MGEKARGNREKIMDKTTLKKKCAFKSRKLKEKIMPKKKCAIKSEKIFENEKIRPEKKMCIKCASNSKKLKEIKRQKRYGKRRKQEEASKNEGEEKRAPVFAKEREAEFFSDLDTKAAKHFPPFPFPFSCLSDRKHAASAEQDHRE